LVNNQWDWEHKDNNKKGKQQGNREVSIEDGTKGEVKGNGKQDGTQQPQLQPTKGRTVLPILLKETPSIKTIALIGPHSISQRGLVGDFYGDAICPGENNKHHREQGCVPTLNASIAQVIADEAANRGVGVGGASVGAGAGGASVGAGDGAGAGAGRVALLVEPGVTITGTNLSGIPAAVAAVRVSDVVLLAVGYDNSVRCTFSNQTLHLRCH
jgi:hypothetical protein